MGKNSKLKCIRGFPPRMLTQGRFSVADKSFPIHISKSTPSQIPVTGHLQHLPNPWSLTGTQAQLQTAGCGLSHDATTNLPTITSKNVATTAAPFSAIGPLNDKPTQPLADTGQPSHADCLFNCWSLLHHPALVPQTIPLNMQYHTRSNCISMTHPIANTRYNSVTF